MSILIRIFIDELYNCNRFKTLYFIILFNKFQNLKKSWHPSTMRNMEKVWQAEQRHEAEQKRIAELQKELREEREREEVRKYAEDQGVVE
jgi:hypothetical protein